MHVNLYLLYSKAIKNYACDSRINTLLNYLGNDREWRHRVIWIRTHIKRRAYNISDDIDGFNDSSMEEKSRFILRPTENAIICVIMRCDAMRSAKNGMCHHFFGGELRKAKICSIGNQVRCTQRCPSHIYIV